MAKVERLARIVTRLVRLDMALGIAITVVLLAWLTPR